MGIYGIGVDSATISRVEKSAQRPGFLEKCYGPQERAMLAARGSRPRTLAANFAAKEAFGKALGTGLSGFALCEVQALRNEAGAPYFVCSGRAAQLLAQRKLKAHLSLTHEGDLATAFVVLETVEPSCACSVRNTGEKI